MTFYVKNKKKMFGLGKAAVLSVEEALQVAPNLVQFGFDESAEDFDVEAFYDSGLSDYECLIVGVEGLSGRGFELGFNKDTDSYNVRIGTPSTRQDWKIALEYLKNLALKMGGDISNEEGEKFSPQSIEGFDYEYNINSGLNALKSNLQDDNSTSLNVYGVTRPVAFNRETVDQILVAPNPIDAFSTLVTDIQNLDAYSAKQQFYRKGEGGEIMGHYVLSQNLPTILPYKPNVEWQNSQFVSNKDVAYWRITFVLLKDENDLDSSYMIDEMDYGAFIEALPKDKYRFIDASYILIEALSEDEMKALASKIKGE